jgi:hypothetical protein
MSDPDTKILLAFGGLVVLMCAVVSRAVFYRPRSILMK